MGWFDKGNGWIEQEGNWLMGYTLPTGGEAVDVVKSKLHRYASADIHPDYKSAEVMAFETIDLEEIEAQEVIKMEDNMADENVIELADLQAENDKLKAKIAKLEAKIAELEGGKKDEGDKMPPAFAKKFEALEAENKAIKLAQAEMVRKLEFEALVANVEATIAKAGARRDENGYGLPAITLNLAKAIMLGQAVQDGEAVIELENSEEPTVKQYREYVFKAVNHFINTIQLTTPMGGNTHHTEEKPNNGSDVVAFGMTSEQLDKFYANAAAQARGITLEEVN
jgi:hypothetical protein